MRKSVPTYHGKGNETVRIGIYRFIYHQYDKQGINLVIKFQNAKMTVNLLNSNEEDGIEVEAFYISYCDHTRVAMKL